MSSSSGRNDRRPVADQSPTNRRPVDDIPFADDEESPLSPLLPDVPEPSSLSSSTLLAAESDGLNTPRLTERRNLPNLEVKIADSTKEQPSPPSPAAIDSPHSSEHSDSPGPLVGIMAGTGGRSFRRNSISLPAGLDSLDLEALRQAHMDHVVHEHAGAYDGESMACSIADRDHDDTDDDAEEEEEHNTPPPPVYKFRTKRRLSVAPLPAFRLNDKEMIANEFDSQSVISNQNSITSVSSLASLLKEKMQNFPAMIKRKKKSTKDYKIKAFVTILFMIIVFLVGYAYIMYNQQVLAHAYFDKVKFNKANREFKVFDAKGADIITGHLGTTITVDKPYDCLGPDKQNDGSICLEWTERARLYLNFRNEGTSLRCYTIRWQALIDDLYPTDCFDVGEDRGSWYGGGATRHSDWPLDSAEFDFEPFVTGDAHNQQWGNAIARYFVNSRGVAIQVNETTPLYVSMNHNGSERFCLRAKHDDFAFVNRLTPFPELSYKICTTDDMLNLHQQMKQQSLWDGLKEKDIGMVHALIDEPVWQIPAASAAQLIESRIYNYTEDVIALGFFPLGHVLVNEFWQKHIGDFTLDKERFQTFEESVNILHRRGFRIIFTVQPFIGTESPNFAETVAKGLLIYERHSEQSIPALTRYKSTASAAVLDMTNNATVAWLQMNLDRVVKDTQIDGFYIDYGSAYNMPHYYQCRRPMNNPDSMKTTFTTSLEDRVGLIGVSGAVTVPRPPAFLSLPPVNSSWAGLQTIIKTTLVYGIIGFPFLMPGAVGGDFYVPRSAMKSIAHGALNETPLPERELYMRWLQLATFLPVLRFSHLPSEYKNDGGDALIEAVRELTAIRKKTVIPVLTKYLNDAMNDGKPLIRPLWMLDSQDAACFEANDEFSIGDELIVAPILEKGQTQREVYLPQGVWKDGIDGSLRKGSRWIHNYRVPEDKVAYFVKMPDNTRF